MIKSNTLCRVVRCFGLGAQLNGKLVLTTSPPIPMVSPDGDKFIGNSIQPYLIVRNPAGRSWVVDGLDTTCLQPISDPDAVLDVETRTTQEDKNEVHA